MKKAYITLIVLFGISAIYWIYRVTGMTDPYTDPALGMGAIILVYLSVIGVLVSICIKNQK